MKHPLQCLSSIGLVAGVLALASCSGAPSALPGYAHAPGGSSATRLTYGYATLYSFQGSPYDGATPERHLLNVNGTLLGMTTSGGTGCRGGCGTLFAISPSGMEHIFYSFTGFPNGFFPEAGLVYRNGELYGTTRKGGAYNRGTVYKVNGFGTEQVLHSFYKVTRDGAYPEAGLSDFNGTLYGTTHGGGSNGRGTIFKITTSGKESVIYAFGTNSRNDGAFPATNLVALKGVFYGTTTGGGTHSGCPGLIGCGTVFAVTPSGKERVIHNFTGTESDGGQPPSGLTVVNGDLYGTTVYGGLPPCYAGCGVVFRVTTSGTETILHRFRSGYDGAYPGAGVAPINGALYGTTTNGGGYYGCSDGCGTVYRIDSARRETVLYRFRGYPDGQNPEGALTEVNGVLYGTTAYGGTFCEGFYSSGCGTVYEILP
jgi:uncharacterized repeat protein (TIGR03803 family)